MFNITPEQVYEAIRKLLPEMSENMRKQAEELLQRAQKGEKVDNDLIDLARQDNKIREALKRKLFPEVESRERLLEYEPLPGNNDNISASTTYKCPEPECEFTWHAPQMGAEPPLCPTHHRALIPVSKKGK